MDRIIIRGLRAFAYHGVRDYEKKNGQVFILDLTLYTSLEKAAHSDHLDDTVNYSAVSQSALRIFTQNRFDLIERAAGALADGILSEYPAIQQITIQVKKPRAPISADFEYVAVELTRERGNRE